MPNFSPESQFRLEKSLLNPDAEVQPVVRQPESMNANMNGLTGPPGLGTPDDKFPKRREQESTD